MYDLPGFDDEEERRRQLLGGLLSAGGIMPQEPATAAPAEDTPAVASALRAPDTSFMQQQPGSIPGYTPPPVAAPEFMQRVQSGHEFGVGDIAMLGGILAALLAGGKNGGAIAAGLAGQYGQGIIGDMARRNERNAEIDKYNNKLANENTEYDRWKADTEAKLAYGSLAARNKGLEQDAAREKRIADRLALLDDPNSAPNKTEVTQAERIAKARSGVEIEEAQKRSEIEYKKQELLAKLLGKGKFAAPKGPAAAKPKTPKQELEDYTNAEKLRLIKAGKMNLAGEMLDEHGNVIPKPKAGTTAADGSVEPFADTEYENEALFKESVSTAGNYQKNRQADADMAAGIQALQTMENLLTEHGSQWGSTEESNKLIGQFNTAKGTVQTAIGAMKNLGILQPAEALRIEKEIGADMSHGLSDLTKSVGYGDLRVGRLQGVRKTFEEALAARRHAIGLRKGSGKPKPAADGPSGAAPTGATRTVTIVYGPGDTETADLTPAEIETLKAQGIEVH